MIRYDGFAFVSFDEVVSLEKGRRDWGVGRGFDLPL